MNRIDPWGLEYVVASGSEENVIWNRRYKYNFIETAVKKLRELKNLNDGETITWLISSFDYSKKDMENFRATATDIGVNIEFFSSKDEFIGYINTKGIFGDNSARLDDPIRKIAIFAHGAAGLIDFGAYGRRSGELQFTMGDISRLNGAAFDNPNSWFGSCNAATPTSDGGIFAQSWVNKVGGTTWGMYLKTNYGSINNLDNWRTIIKPERKAAGYRQSGSDYYPNEGRGANWVTFTNSLVWR